MKKLKMKLIKQQKNQNLTDKTTKKPKFIWVVERVYGKKIKYSYSRRFSPPKGDIEIFENEVDAEKMLNL